MSISRSPSASGGLYVPFSPAVGTVVETHEVGFSVVLRKLLVHFPQDTFLLEARNLGPDKVEISADFSSCVNLSVSELAGTPSSVVTLTLMPGDVQVLARLVVLDVFREARHAVKYRLCKVPFTAEERMALSEDAEFRIAVHCSLAESAMGRFPAEVCPVEEVLEQVRSSMRGMSFLDLDFPPVYKSLAIDPSKLEDRVVWCRPKEFLKGNITVFGKHIGPADIHQGKLGNWPELIRRLFTVSEYSDEGLYRVVVGKNGYWHTVTVDDYFPCTNGMHPVCAGTLDSELWCMLIEKAYAKLNGSYANLRSGTTSESLIDLTCCPFKIYRFRDEEEQVRYFEGSLWAELHEFMEVRGYVACASSGNEPGPGEGSGLVLRHAYTVSTMLSIPAEDPAVEGGCHKVVVVRNPWGSGGTFEGQWARNSPLWELPEVRGLLTPSFDDPAVFYMSFEEFFTNFSNMTVCMTQEWTDARYKGSFRVQGTTVKGPVYTLEVLEAGNYFLSLHQEDERAQQPLDVRRSQPGQEAQASKEEDLIGRPYIDAGVVVAKREGGELRIVAQNATNLGREHQLNCHLSEGEYFVIPITTGCRLPGPDTIWPEGTPCGELLSPDRLLSPLFQSTIENIFWGFDQDMKGVLTMSEFNELMERMGRAPLSQEQFQEDILDSLCSNSFGVSVRGLQQWFRLCLESYGEEEVFLWLENLGYNRQLQSVSTRSFVVSCHSESLFCLSVFERENSVYMEDAWVQLACQFNASTVESVPYFKSSNGHSFTFVATNESPEPMEMVVDFSKSQNVTIFPREGALVRDPVPSDLVVERIVLPFCRIPIAHLAMRRSGSYSFSYSTRYTSLR